MRGARRLTQMAMTGLAGAAARSWLSILKTRKRLNHSGNQLNHVGNGLETARAACPSASGQIGAEAAKLPLILEVIVLSVVEHTKSSGRFEVVTLMDPEFVDSGCTLTVIVRTGEFKAGENAFFIPVGTRVPEDFATRCGWEGLLAESDFVVKPSNFGRDYLSNGLLLPRDLLRDVLQGPEESRELKTDELHDLAQTLNLAHAIDSEWNARSFLLEIGFDNSYFGSQWTGTEDQRPTVVGQILEAVQRSGLCPGGGRPRMSQWVALSRVDSGVSARSFKVTTPPLIPADNMAKTIGLELPSNILIHRAIAIPRGVQLSPAQRITRDYGYFFPPSLIGGTSNSSRDQLEALLQSFCGEHCFANFTELKKLEGLKKKIQRNKGLQTWAHELQSWKRSRRMQGNVRVDCLGIDDADVESSNSPVSTIKVHGAMKAACNRNILKIAVEMSLSSTAKLGDSELMCVRIKGDGFLYNMVRYVVGSALAVVMGRLSAKTLETALESSMCVDLSEHLAPAHGLVLLDQSLEADWSWPGSELATLSADKFLKEQLLPQVQQAWHQNSGWLRETIEKSPDRFCLDWRGGMEHDEII